MREQLFLKNMIENPEYAKRVIPHLKSEYFQNIGERLVFEAINNHVNKHQALPTLEVIGVDVIESCQNETLIQATAGVLDAMSDPKIKKANTKWLIEKTEQFAQERAVEIAYFKVGEIMTGKDTKLGKGAIPELLKQALTVSFESSIGIDYENDIEKIYDRYHNQGEKIEFHLELLNRITNGGIYKKTLTILMASTGVGKSLNMCDWAANHYRMGKNVLYITLEMAEERITKRIDANLLDIDINEMDKIPKERYIRMAREARKQCTGRFFIKEYPTACANVNHFRALLADLELKKDFKPDIIYVDYLSIATSARITKGSGSYEYVKSIAEELRGLAVEYGIAVVSATQTNRDGAGNSDVELTNTAESWGLPSTADLFLAVSQSEEQAKAGHYLFKQLKNRDGDLYNPNKFLVGIEKSKMRLFDVDGSLETSSKPIPKSTTIAEAAFDEDDMFSLG